jgi:hypothetical protein
VVSGRSLVNSCAARGLTPVTTAGSLLGPGKRPSGATAAGILLVQRIDPGHDPKHRFTHWRRPAVERGSRQTQQHTLPADAEFRVVVIDQLTQFTGVRPAEIFFEPLQLHLQPPDLLEQLLFLGLNRLFNLGLAAPCEQLTGTMQKLPLPVAHLNGMGGVIGGDLLDRLETTDGLNADPGLVLGAVGAAHAHRWEPLSGAAPRLSG